MTLIFLQLFQFPPFKFNFEKSIQRCHNAMKFDVNKSTILNRFVLHTLQRNITHLAVITGKTNIKLAFLKGGNWNRAATFFKTRRNTFIQGQPICSNFPKSAPPPPTYHQPTTYYPTHDVPPSRTPILPT